MRSLYCVFVVFVLSFLHSKNAFANLHGSHLHFDTGFVMTTFSGPTPEAAFLVAPSFNFEYERFLSSQSSVGLRAIFAMDMETTVTRYMLAGVSQKFYLFGRGSFIEASSRETHIVLSPKMRFFVGYTVGLSQVVAQTFTSVLQTFTTMFDAGATLGASYRLRNTIHLQGKAEVAYAYGFSSVAISGVLIRGFLGINYTF